MVSMIDPISYLAGSIERELHADDDATDDFYRNVMKCSEGEIASYRATRYLMRSHVEAPLPEPIR